MAEISGAGAERAVSPKDVFQRSNMPSRWERLTGVSPKIDADRRFLVFMANRYRGEARLPHPDDMTPPAALFVRTIAMVVAAGSVLIGALGLANHPAMAVVGGALLACALLVLLAVAAWTGPSIRQYRDLRARAVEAESRLQSERLSTADAGTLNEMIQCDEGTLAYCAAKIASEIDRDPGWGTHSVGFLQIDLWDELADVGASARGIAQDRKATEQLERGRLRDDPEIRAVITEDKRQRRAALDALAARIHDFADYRDRIQRISAREVRDRSSLDRATRLVSDEQARNRPT